MRPAQSAVRAFTSILGSLGQGTATTTPHFSITLNPAGIAAAPSIQVTAPPFTAQTTGKILVAAFMGVTTQANADEVEFILTKDLGGLASNVLSNGIPGAGLPLCNATLFNVDQVAVGATHTYGIEAVVIQPGGHTVAVISGGQVGVLVYELP